MKNNNKNKQIKMKIVYNYNSKITNKTYKIQYNNKKTKKIFNNNSSSIYQNLKKKFNQK